MMSSMSSMLPLKSWAIARVASTRRRRDGPSPPTASDVSCSSDATLSLGSAANARLAASSAGPIWLGTVVLVIVCSIRQVRTAGAGRHQVKVLLADRRHRVHIGRRIGGDLVAIVDAHRRPRAALGGFDGGDGPYGDAPIRDVGGSIKSPGLRQFGIQRVSTDADKAGYPQEVPAQDHHRGNRQHHQQHQLGFDEASQHLSLAPLHQRSSGGVIRVRRIADVRDHGGGVASPRLFERPQRPGETGSAQYRVIDGGQRQVELRPTR